MTIANILQSRESGVISCTAETSVREAVELLAEKRIGALPVVDGDQVVGIFSERDVIYGLRDRSTALLDMAVGEVMTSPPVTVSSDTAVMAALSLMTRRRIRHLPVVDDDCIVAFISIGDLVKYRVEKIESEAAAMRDYITGAS
ncbi:MAG: CBS domain-containing protein [Blastomonas sp.]